MTQRREKHQIRSGFMTDVGDLIFAILRDRSGFGVSPSLGWLTSMVLVAADPADETLESEAMRAVTKAAAVGGIPGIRDLGRVSGLEGRPRVFAIRPEHGGPEDPESLIRHRVEALGSPAVRRAMLEDRLVAELRSRGLWVMSFARQFHKVSADFAVRGEDGQSWNVECRNLRWATTVRLHPRDRRVAGAARRHDVRSVFVVPKATHRFRREVAELDGIVLESRAYLVEEVAQLEALREIGLPWDAALSGDAIGRIAEDLVKEVGPLVPSGNQSSVTQGEDDAAEVKRLISLKRRFDRWDAARSYRAGHPTPERVTMEELARHAGVTSRTLRRDCELFGSLVGRGRKPNRVAE